MANADDEACATRWRGRRTDAVAIRSPAKMQAGRRDAQYHPRPFLSRRAGRPGRRTSVICARWRKIGHFNATELLLVGGGSRKFCGIKLKRINLISLSKCWI